MELFLMSLSILWKGMLGIFIVIGLIMVMIIILNRVCAPKNGNNAGNADNSDNNE